MKTRYYLTSLLFCLTFYVQAQSLEEYIPSDVFAVVTFDAESYTKKTEQVKFIEAAFINSFNEQLRYSHPVQYTLITKAYEQPETVGINLLPKNHIFFQNLDTLSTIGYLFHVQDNQKLSDFIEQTLEESEKNFQKVENEGYAFFSDGESCFAWSDDIAILMQIEGNAPLNDINYDDPDYYEKLEKAEEDYKLKKAVVLEQQIALMMTRKATQVIGNANYQIFSKERFDVGVWVDFSQFNQAFDDAMRNLNDLGISEKRFIERLKTFLEDNYYQFLLNFEQDEALLEQRQYTSEKLFESISSLYDERVDPRFFEYVEGKNLLSLFSFAVDPNKLLKSTIELYEPILKETDYGETIIAGLELLDIAIDQEAILSTVKGDVLVAVTDVRPIETVYYDYEYDGDVYLGRVEKKKEKNMPIFVMMLGIGNQDNINKLVRFLEATDYLVNQGEYYLMDKMKEFPTFLALKDDILFITNDEALVKSKLKRGVKKKKRVDENLQKLTQQYAQTVYVDLDRIFEEFLKEEGLSEKDKEQLTNLKKSYDYFEYYGANVGDRLITYQAKLKLKSNKLHSLDALLKTLELFIRPSYNAFEVEDVIIEEKVAPAEESIEDDN